MQGATPIRDDKTSVAPDVLVTIARLSALSVEGVVGITPGPSGVHRLLRRGADEGVLIELAGDTIRAQLYLVVAAEYNVRAVSRAVQEEVTRAMHDIVGLEVERVDVYIEDVSYEE